MHKGEELDCKLLSVIMRYPEIFFFQHRIFLDLNYAGCAGTSLTVITEMF